MINSPLIASPLTCWEPFKRRWAALEKKLFVHGQSHGNPLATVQTPMGRPWKKKFAHGQSHGNPLGTVQTPMGEPSKEDVRTWPESRELAGNRSNADGKSLKRNCSHMAKVTGTRWEPFKRRWEGLEKKKFAHGQSHGNPLGTVQTPMGRPSKEGLNIQFQLFPLGKPCRIIENLLKTCRISRNLPGWRNFDWFPAKGER